LDFVIFVGFLPTSSIYYGLYMDSNLSFNYFRHHHQFIDTAAACIRGQDRGREKCTSAISDIADKLTEKNLIDSSADCRAPPFQQWNVNLILDPFTIKIILFNYSRAAVSWPAVKYDIIIITLLILVIYVLR
jgi:hypothetical protein